MRTYLYRFALVMLIVRPQTEWDKRGDLLRDTFSTFPRLYLCQRKVEFSSGL